jgi:putative oxidoreductase
MKIAVIVVRVLMGLAFFASGLMKIIPMAPSHVPTGDAGAMMGLMVAHKWLLFYGFVEASAGLMLVVGRFVPLGLTLLAGMIVNIILFDITLTPQIAMLIPGLVMGFLEVFLVYVYRDSFAGIFSAKAQPAV